MSVTPAAPAPGPPKKTDDKSFFDVSICYLLNESCSLTLSINCKSYSNLKKKNCLHLTNQPTLWLMEPGSSMPYSQGPSNNLYPQPNQPNSSYGYLFL